jgi:hypothetical protein
MSISWNDIAHGVVDGAFFFAGYLCCWYWKVRPLALLLRSQVAYQREREWKFFFATTPAARPSAPSTATTADHPETPAPPPC